MPKIWHKKLTGLEICILSGKSKGTKEGFLEEKWQNENDTFKKLLFQKSVTQAYKNPYEQYNLVFV